MRDFLLRPVRLEDAEALWRHFAWQDTLDETRTYLAWCLRQTVKGRLVRLVAQADGQVVGQAQLALWPDRGEIGSLAVAQGYRRRGIASALVAALTEEARRRGVRRLEIGAQAAQPELIALYCRWGFAPCQEIELPRLSGNGRVIYCIKDLTLPDQGEFQGGWEGL